MINMLEWVYLFNVVGQGVITCTWAVIYFKISKRRDNHDERLAALELWVKFNDKQMVRKWDIPQKTPSPSDLAYMQERGMQGML